MLRAQSRCDYATARLDDGRKVRLRPLLPGEVGPLQTVFDGMSPTSRGHRYLTGMTRLPANITRALTTVDSRDHVAWVATLRDDPVGLARYIRLSPDTAEIAFEVVDALHGRGLGGILFDALATLAHAHGVRWFKGMVDPLNSASAGMLRRRGMDMRLADGLLEGLGPVVPPRRTRVDRRALLTVAARYEQRLPAALLCANAVCSA